jgi:hypothetical protein
MELQPLRRFLRADALGREALERAKSAHVAAERPRETRRDVTARARLVLEDRLADLERATALARRPRLGELVRRHVRVGCDESGDLTLADRLA